MDIKKILKSPVYVTPNFPIVKTKRYKYSVLQLLTGLVLYSLIISAIFLLLLIFTPLKSVMFFVENQQLEAQVNRVQDLETKIVYLTKELESISSENKKLKYAFLLGTVDSIDSNSAIYDSLREEKDKNLNIEGSVLKAFNSMMDYLFNDNKDNELYFRRPSSGYVIKGFEPNKGHLGIDYGVKAGTPVYSASGGLVIFSDYVSDDGNMIMIQHENDFITVYKHCSVLIKKQREKVIQGEVIALSGNTGKTSTGPHLHFEIWKNGNAVNPKKFLINN